MSDNKNTKENDVAACPPQTELQAESAAGNKAKFQSVNTENLTEGGEEKTTQENAAEKSKPTRLQRFLQFLKFTLFSASAGAIQLLSTTLLHEWTGWLKDYYYIAYIIGLTLSVIWNFTFNRKFTFKAANNVPIAMTLVIIYNCIIVVPLAFGGDALVEIWGDGYGILVTAISLLINFITEFFWDKFIVFNSKVTDKILKWFKRTKKDSDSTEHADTAANDVNAVKNSEEISQSDITETENKEN